MPQLELLVVAEHVVVDATSNAVSLFNIFEEIKTTGFPILVPQMVVLSRWRKEEADEGRDLQGLLRATIPGSGQQDFAMNFRFTHAIQRLLHKIHMVPIQHAGMLTFQILLNGEQKGTYSVPVIQDPSAGNPFIQLQAQPPAGGGGEAPRS